MGSRWLRLGTSWSWRRTIMRSSMQGRSSLRQGHFPVRRWCWLGCRTSESYTREGNRSCTQNNWMLTFVVKALHHTQPKPQAWVSRSLLAIAVRIHHQQSPSPFDNALTNNHHRSLRSNVLLPQHRRPQIHHGPRHQSWGNRLESSPHIREYDVYPVGEWSQTERQAGISIAKSRR